MSRIKLFEQFAEALLEYQSNPEYANFAKELKGLVSKYQDKKLSKDAMMAAAQEIMVSVTSEDDFDPIEIGIWSFTTDGKSEIVMKTPESDAIVVAATDGSSRATVKDVKDAQAKATIDKIGLSAGEHGTIKSIWNKIQNY